MQRSGLYLLKPSDGILHNNLFVNSTGLAPEKYQDGIFKDTAIQRSQATGDYDSLYQPC